MRGFLAVPGIAARHGLHEDDGDAFREAREHEDVSIVQPRVFCAPVRWSDSRAHGRDSRCPGTPNLHLNHGAVSPISGEIED